VGAPGAEARVEAVAVAKKARATKRPAKAKSSDKHFEKVAKIARRFPGVEVVSWRGCPSLTVKGKFLARLRTEAEGWLAIRCEFIDRQILLQAAPHVFHLTDHYVNYPAVLVDLAAIDADALADVVERAWRKVAAKKLVREWDEQHAVHA
jgi:hypothetical protein